MSTLALPAWLKAESLTPPTLKRSVYTSVGRYSQATDIGDLMSGDTWAMSIGLAPMARQDAPRLQSFLNQLSGGLNLLACHDLSLPVPQGTLRGSPVLASSMAMGSQTIAVSNARTNANRLIGGNFEVDTNADGIADGWLASQVGTTGTVTYDLVSTPIAGAKAQRFSASGLGTTAGDVAGVRQSLPVADLVGQTVTVWVYMSATATGSPKARLQLRFFDSLGAGLTDIDTGSVTPSTSGYAILSATGVVPVNAATATVSIWLTQRTGSAGFAEAVIDAAQVEVGSTPSNYALPPSLLQGDMLGFGNALFQVAADTVLADAGTGSIPVVNKARTTIASGTPLIWSRPAALWRMVGNPQVLVRPGIADGVQIDLVEKAF